MVLVLRRDQWELCASLCFLPSLLVYLARLKMLCGQGLLLFPVSNQQGFLLPWVWREGSHHVWKERIINRKARLQCLANNLQAQFQYEALIFHCFHCKPMVTFCMIPVTYPANAVGIGCKSLGFSKEKVSPERQKITHSTS